MNVTSPPDGNNTMVPPSVLLQDVVTAVPTGSLSEETLRRQKELEEFYSTYDVWTGIRTAITLALFFVFTVTLILYKSKCKPRRKYELYPSLEDMPGRPLDYCDYWCASPVSVKSLPGSVMRINCSRTSSFERDDASQVAAHSCRSEFLRVPGVRLQSTGSSSDGYSAGSSTHDLPSDVNSMSLLGVPGLGPRSKPLLQLGGMDWDSDHATAEWIQTIDINVIQPTPNISPCGSVRSVSDSSEVSRLPLPGRGRVASVLSIDSPDYDCRSIGSDSVFLEDSMFETGSSFSESIDSGTPSLLATPQSTLSPSPRSARRTVQSYRLGINPANAHRPISPSQSAPVRMQTLSNLHNLHRPSELRGRKRPLQRQRVQDLTAAAAIPMMGTLLVPLMGSNLNASCERLAAYSALSSDADLASSRGSCSLAPTSSVEDEPMCAVFTVPALRRTNSATTPEMKAEAVVEFKRADSEQNPKVRRSDSATQQRSSESSSGSDDESVSFHLMVPQLSVDIPSADTSRASTPTLSPSVSPLASPLPSRLSTSRCSSRSQEPKSSIKRKGSKRGSSKSSSRNGKRVLKRQHNVQCAPISPTLMHNPPVSQTSLPTYLEEVEDDDIDELSLPPAPPSSPYPTTTQHLQREDSSPPSPTNSVMETSC